MHEIPLSRPEFDDAEARAVAEVLASGWVSQGPKVARVRGALCRARRRRATASRRRRARPRCISRWSSPASGPATKSSVRRTRSSRPRTPFCTPARRRCSPTSSRTPGTSIRADVAKRVTPRTKAILAGASGRAGRRSRSTERRCRPGRHDRRRRRLRDRLDLSRPAGRFVTATSPASAFTRERRFRLGEGGMLTTDDADDRRARAAAAVARRQRVGLVAAPGEGRRVRGVPRARLQLPDDRHAGGDRHRAAEASSTVCWRGGARSPTATTPRSARCRELQMPAQPAYAAHAYQSYGIRLTPELPRRARRRDARAGRASASRAGAAFRRFTSSRSIASRFGPMSLPVTEEVAARIDLPADVRLAVRRRPGRVIDAVIAHRDPVSDAEAAHRDRRAGASTSATTSARFTTR